MNVQVSDAVASLILLFESCFFLVWIVFASTCLAFDKPKTFMSIYEASESFCEVDPMQPAF